MAFIEVIDFSSPESWEVVVEGDTGRVFVRYEEQFITLQEAKLFAIERIRDLVNAKISVLNEFNRWYGLHGCGYSR